MTKLNKENMLTVLTALNLHSVEAAKTTLSNSAKAFQLTTWIRDGLRESRLDDFFQTVESAINALPAGTVSSKVRHPVTGAITSKDTKYRDIAKRSIVTAWNNAIKGDAFTQHSTHTIKFKLSRPQLEKVAEKADLEKRVSNLLKESIDSKGLESIMLAINTAINDYSQDIEELAASNRERELNGLVQADYAMLVLRGETNNEAAAKTAMLHDMDYDSIDKIVSV